MPIALILFRPGRLITWAVLACLLGPLTWAGATEGSVPDYFLRSWNTENGLPDHAVTAMAQDLDGYLWIGTYGGLARFDGSRWRVFTQGDGLKSGTLNALTWGKDAIWFSYRDALGITSLRLDGERVQTNHFTQRDGLSSDMVYALAFDQEGRLWASTDNGVNVLARSHWSHYGTEDGLIWDDGDDRALYVDRNNSVWVGTSQGLSRFAAPHDPIPDVPPPAVLTSIIKDTVKAYAHDTRSPAVAVKHANAALADAGFQVIGTGRNTARTTAPAGVTYLDLDVTSDESVARAVAGRVIIGGPAPAQVTREVQRLAAELKGLGYEV